MLNTGYWYIYILVNILVVLQAYSRLSGRTSQECIVEASEYCTKKTTHQGIFFEVSVSHTIYITIRPYYRYTYYQCCTYLFIPMEYKLHCITCIYLLYKMTCGRWLQCMCIENMIKHYIGTR